MTTPADDGQIEGYTTRVSGLPGTAITLKVSTSATTYTVTAYRIGNYPGGGLSVWRSGPLPGGRQAAGSFSNRYTRTVHATWHRSLTVPTVGWLEGFYLLKLVGSDGWQAHVPYVVRSSSSEGKVALVEPVATWQAYNTWGDYDFYEGRGSDRAAWAVSFDRPFPPPGASEMRFGVIPVVRAAERAGVPLAYLTDIDLDADPHALDGARAFVSPGHDEYWTDRMRAEVLHARDAGTNLLFLGANTAYWKVRLEPTSSGPRRLLVGYRREPSADPLRDTGRAAGKYREQGSRSAENVLTGMEYECFPVDASWAVASPRWWGYRGTGVRRGTSFAHLVGVEGDRVYPIATTPRPLQVIADTAYSCGGVPTSAQATYYTTASGAGVLDVGTLRWTCAFAGRCPTWRLGRRTTRFVRTVTRTVLRQFAAGPAGARHPARDNLARFDLPTVNEVPAS